MFLKYPMEAIRDEVFRLQDHLLRLLDSERFEPLLFPRQHRSGILAAHTRVDPLQLVDKAEREGLVVTAPAGYLRLAPHFYLSEGDMAKAVIILNSIS